jgi:hypothetical protein
VLNRIHGYRSGARGLLRGADSALRRDVRVVRTSEVALSSFTFGLLQGRYKDKGGAVLLGLPIDLLAGASFHIFALLPWARGYAHHLHAFGDGALASFFTTTGYRVGERWARGGSFRTGLAGMFGDGADQPVSGGSSIADKELESLVRAG